MNEQFFFTQKKWFSMRLIFFVHSFIKKANIQIATHLITCNAKNVATEIKHGQVIWFLKTFPGSN